MKELKDQLIQKYENLLLKAQMHKMPEREMTIFDTAFRKHHENPTTELLSFFLDPDKAHNLGISFYKGFIAAIKENNNQYKDFDFGDFIQVQTEEITEQGKRIDLWLETNTALIIVELKVNNAQNNPFLDYVAWGKNQVKRTKKELLKIVLCIEGECTVKDWFGLSYWDLSQNIRTYLGAIAIEKSLSKWSIFARDFLLHLENFYNLLETDMDRIQFVISNMKKIQELVELREAVYQEIIQHIENSYNNVFDEENNLKIQRDNSQGSQVKAWRFKNTKFKSESDIVLYLNLDTEPMNCEVWLCMDQRSSELDRFLAREVKKGKFSSFITSTKNERDNRYRSICWSFENYELNEITDLIIQNQKILNKVEFELK